ncbi:Protein kinase domain [Dillenia turbinata]|uniref:Protein kinase domain n=1 Tax=Dillenia turbinata TaxID=194707 RepID=A0AAN8UJC2_9MAGN
MNQYHVYEAIGRGKCSTVYKGRMKKTIEYFAIKSVDKSQKNKILQEVRILHALDHPNVIKFHAWYETSAHLWLVLEYCVGGDLLTLLDQDKQLPEESIHDLAYGLVKALQYLHSEGVIYCDLKPSNILLDENGHTKLCDFGLARKLKDISNTPTSSLPPAKRGTPCYMAPELFQDGGVHSYASDFWALGCVLYECYAGRPPFVGREFTQLVKSILSDPIPPLPGTPTRPFANLISSLLVKDPSDRLQWPDLCGHAFWSTKHSILSLPPQPAFDIMIGLSSKPFLSERNGEKPLHNRTPTKYREKDSKVAPKSDVVSVAGARGNETPIKNTVSGRKIQSKPPGKVAEKPKDPPSATKKVNLLRLSRIVKTNIQRENEKENYRRPLPNSENDTEIKIENNDMELDFDENTDTDAQEDPDGACSAALTPEENTSTHGQQRERIEEADSNIKQVDASPLINCNTADDQPGEQESCPDVGVAATPPSAGTRVRSQMCIEDSGNVPDSGSPKAHSNLSQVLWHSSDLSVRPVMPSRKADKISEKIPSLPFEALPASDFGKVSKDQRDALSNKIIAILNGNSVQEKQNVIKYLEMLSNNADVANILTNGPVMLVLVKMLRQPKSSVLRVQLLSLIGLLIRHSNFIEEDLSNSGILGALAHGLKHELDNKARRFSMAALGELLFYISTQNEHAGDSNPPESPSKEGRPSSGWQVPNSSILLVSSILQKGQDDMTQLYALRTIENICSRGAQWAARFASSDVISNLCYIFRAAGKQESMRLTAGSCLVRLCHFNPPTLQSVIEKLSFKEIASALVKGNVREQQISLNLLNMAMLGSHMFSSMGRYLVPLMEEKNLVPSLVSLIEQGNEVLRGKALLFVALLCKNGRRWLPHFFCNPKLLSVVDRLAKEKDSYVKRCLDAFVHVVASSVPGLLENITGDIQQMMGGRRHVPISALSSRAAPKNNIHLFPVVLHLLGSLSFKQMVATYRVLQQLANLMKLAESPFQGRDDFQITLLRVLESISDEPAVLDASNIFILDILPSLAILYKGNKDGDARFLCLKIMFDVLVILLNEESVCEQSIGDLKTIANGHFLPLYPSLIEDEDPIPMYAQKLLVMLIELNCIKISDILQLKTISQCFEFLLGDLSSANVNNVKLCLALACAPELESKILSQLKVVRRIGNLLEFVNAREREDFLEPSISLCKAFLLRSVGNKKGSAYSKEPALLCDNSSEACTMVDPQQCIRDIMDFGSNAGVFLELSSSHEANVADIASECVILLLKAAPREGTTGFLTNLSKVSVILESWRRGIPHLILQRILYALGYSCRQYLSQAMILSISTLEITKIEAIVSELKNSSTKGVADAAFLVALEMQRLPRL